jgi:arylformamidase
MLDITIPLTDGMIHWPNDPAVSITTLCDVTQGDAATVRQLLMGSHTGTHVDAPCHFIPHAATLDDIPLTTWVGETYVLAIDPHAPAVEAEHLDALFALPRLPQRVLFKTGNSQSEWWHQPFNTSFVHLTLPAAQRLLTLPALCLVGIDYLSIDAYAATGAPVHHALLGQQVGLLEGLNLCHVPQGWYHLSAAPLRIAGGDGAPTRAILQPLSQL